MRVCNPDCSASLAHADRVKIVLDCRTANDQPPDVINDSCMFYGTQTAQRDGDDGGGLGPLVIHPTITTVIATRTNIKFSTWFRNVFYDFIIGIFPIPSDT